MAKAKCARQYFTKALENQLNDRAIGVAEGLSAHASQFPAPPFSAAQIRALVNNYNNTLTAYRRGGLDQKAAYFHAKQTLTDAVLQVAAYVDNVAAGNEELIVNAGFTTTKTTRSKKAMPDKPLLLEAEVGPAEGHMTVQCEAIKDALFYGLIASEGVPLQGLQIINGRISLKSLAAPLIFDINKNRVKQLSGLKPGVVYYIYMYAGNNNGTSALSDALQRRAV